MRPRLVSATVQSAPGVATGDRRIQMQLAMDGNKPLRPEECRAVVETIGRPLREADHHMETEPAERFSRRMKRGRRLRATGRPDPTARSAPVPGRQRDRPLLRARLRREGADAGEIVRNALARANCATATRDARPGGSGRWP